VPVLLVRHAVAVARRRWDGPDDLRPLTGRGSRQAQALVGLLERFGVARVLSSPSARCRDTVAPLAHHRSLPVEEVDDLAEGRAGAATALARSCADVDVVLCTHGDVVPEVLEALDEGRLGLARHVPLAKGSVWLLEGRDGGFTGACYLPPPA
jgi:8-oxo-dGTP diphosphatase